MFHSFCQCAYNYVGEARWLIGGLLAAGPVFTANAFSVFETSHTDYRPLQRYVQAELSYASVDAVSYTGLAPQHTTSEPVYAFGLVVQQTRETGDLQYGLEGGARLGLGSDRDWAVRLSGSRSTVKVRTDLWVGDLTFGGFASFKTSPWVRWYAAAGPAVYWARANQEDTDSRNGARSGAVIDLREDRDHVDFAWYQRAGVEFTFADTRLGLSIRRMDARLDIDGLGRIDLDEPTYQLTLGYSY